MKKIMRFLLAFVLLSLVLGELFARYYVGLGDPPLYVVDPDVEYLLKPNYEVRRFGNRHHTNQFSMRSDSLTKRSTANDLRIMTFGDSVLYGGSYTDQSDLATSIMEDEVSKLTSKNVYVGNISASSWGPGNWLAYAQKYGFFDAKLVVLIISSHDYIDNPTYKPLSKSYPTERPISALWEGGVRYLPKYLARFKTKELKKTARVYEPSKQRISTGLTDLKNFLTLAQKNASKVLVFQHWEKNEITQGQAKSGNIRIGALCESLGIETIQLEPYFKSVLSNDENPYRDNIHLNDLGQKILAKAIIENIPKNLLH